MISDSSQGKKTGIVIWLIGTVLFLIIHSIFGWDATHVPPTSFIVVVIVLQIAFFRSLSNLRNIFLGRSKEKNKAELSIHFSGMAIVVMTIILLAISSIHR